MDIVAFFLFILAGVCAVWCWLPDKAVDRMTLVGALMSFGLAAMTWKIFDIGRIFN